MGFPVRGWVGGFTRGWGPGKRGRGYRQGRTGGERVALRDGWGPADKKQQGGSAFLVGSRGARFLGGGFAGDGGSASKGQQGGRAFPMWGEGVSCGSGFAVQGALPTAGNDERGLFQREVGILPLGTTTKEKKS